MGAGLRRRGAAAGPCGRRWYAPVYVEHVETDENRHQKQAGMGAGNDGYSGIVWYVRELEGGLEGGRVRRMDGIYPHYKIWDFETVSKFRIYPHHKIFGKNKPVCMPTDVGTEPTRVRHYAPAINHIYDMLPL